jgi:hypothetical protein
MVDDLDAANIDVSAETDRDLLICMGLPCFAAGGRHSRRNTDDVHNSSKRRLSATVSAEQRRSKFITKTFERRIRVTWDRNEINASRFNRNDTFTIPPS